MNLGELRLLKEKDIIHEVTDMVINKGCYYACYDFGMRDGCLLEHPEILLSSSKSEIKEVTFKMGAVSVNLEDNRVTVSRKYTHLKDKIKEKIENALGRSLNERN